MLNGIRKSTSPSTEEEHDASSSNICNDVTATKKTPVPAPAKTLTLTIHITHNMSASRSL